MGRLVYGGFSATQSVMHTAPGGEALEGAWGLSYHTIVAKKGKFVQLFQYGPKFSPLPSLAVFLPRGWKGAVYFFCRNNSSLTCMWLENVLNLSKPSGAIHGTHPSFFASLESYLDVRVVLEASGYLNIGCSRKGCVSKAH